MISTQLKNVVREMLANPHVDLTRKIRILWRPELYSIQQKYHLPEYKQKSKAFVQKKLVEKLPEMILNEQISQKLFERDYTQIAEEIRNYKKENSRVRCQEKVTCTLSCEQTRDSYLTLFHILSEAFLDIRYLSLNVLNRYTFYLLTDTRSTD